MNNTHAKASSLQDVNAALVKRKAGKNQEGENNVTLSGILNSLDGITAQEGSVVFMTTDHIWKLTLALIRLGHCNRKLHFEYADEHQVQGYVPQVLSQMIPLWSGHQ